MCCAVKCLPGYYFNATNSPPCTPCAPPCTDCFLAADRCTVCDSLLNLQLIGSQCACRPGYVPTDKNASAFSACAELTAEQQQALPPNIPIISVEKDPADSFPLLRIEFPVQLQQDFYL